MLPLPFTLTSLLLIIAAFISKLQYPSSQLTIALHALLGPLETWSLTQSLIVYSWKEKSVFMNFLLFLIALSLIGLFNFLGLAIQTPLIVQDKCFLKWMRLRSERKDMKFNCCWFYFLTVLSLVTSVKLKYIIFSGLFNFDCLKCKLQSVQKFRLFNVFSFLCLVPEIITLYSAIMILRTFNSEDSLFLILLDTVIVVALNIFLSVFAVKKNDDFFEEKLNGIPINKVIQAGQEEFQSSNSISNKKSFVGRQLEDIIELDQVFFNSTLRKVRGGQKEIQEPSKISEQTDEENTVTASHSIAEYKDIENQEVQTEQQQNHQQKENTNNILELNEIIDFQQELPRYLEQRINESRGIEPLNRIIDPELHEQIPQIQDIHPKKIPKDGYSQQISNEYVSDRQEVTERVNLTEYLQRVEKYKVKSQRYHKAEEIEADNSGRSSQPEISRLLSKGNKQKEAYFEEANKEIASQSQIEAEDSDHPKQKSARLMQELKIPSLTNQQTFKINKINQIIANVAIVARSPPKLISNQPSKPYDHSKKKMPIRISINEDHDEKPIRNKSKDHLKVYDNHPIKKGRSTHPILNQQSTTRCLQEEEYEQNQGRERMIPRSRKIKTQITLTQELPQNTITEVLKIQHQSSNSLAKNSQFFEDCLKKEELKKQCDSKQFVRSQIPQIQQFSSQKPTGLICNEIVQDRAPRQPTMVFQLRGKSSRNRSFESVSSLGRVNRRNSSGKLDLQNLTFEDRRKMKSLEKLYFRK